MIENVIFCTILRVFRAETWLTVYRVLYTEAVGVPHGGLGPAPIGKLDAQKLTIERKCCGKLEKRSDQV